jgi:hypothetical protein
MNLWVPSVLRVVREVVGYGLGLFGANRGRRLIRNSSGVARYTNDSIPKIQGDCRNLLESADVFIFDCDGVIWKGDFAVEGADRVLSKLRDLNKLIFFVTNNSTKSRKGFLSKFSSLGIHVNPQGV